MIEASVERKLDNIIKQTLGANKMSKFKAGNKTFNSSEEALEYATAVYHRTGSIVAVEEVKTNPRGAFNGFRSWNAWNVSLWINNDEGLYRMAQECVEDAKRSNTRKDGESVKDLAAKMFFVRVDGDKTPDGAPYSVTTIKAAMREM
jgi:hypothetical protein